MENRDEYLLALQGMWGEMKSLNARVTMRLDTVTARLEETNERLARVEGRLQNVEGRLENVDLRLEEAGRRLNETSIRVVAELSAGNELLREALDEVRGARVDRRRLDKLEHRVEVLEKRSP